MPKKLVHIALLMLFSMAIFAQSESQADNYYKNGKYAEACAAYKRLYNARPDNPYYVYRYARCLQELGRAEEALPYFEQEITAKYSTRSYFLGRAYLDTYRFISAEEYLRDFVEGDNERSEYYADAQKYLAQAAKMARYMRRTENVMMIDSIQIRKNRILEAYHLSPDAGNVSPDGTYTNARGDRRIHSMPDGTMLAQSKLLDQWSEPDTLPFRGYHPFLLGDGVTLYFAAEEEDGMGGMDIYLTRFNTATNAWLQPTIVGMPYSSTDDDYLLCIDETTQRGYFTSTRHCSSDTLATVYTFIPVDHKTYLRDSEENDIREMALLHVFAQLEQPAAEVEEQPASSALGELRGSEPDFVYVVCDTLVCYRLEDFRQPEARQLYEEWMAMQEEITAQQQVLLSKREAYRTATPDERRALAPLIIAMENDLHRLTRDADAIYLQVRREELRQK